MMNITTIAQAVAVISACWAIISGVGAWKREFIGKRRIELAEQLLGKFFEVVDAVAYIRSPFSSSDEGKSRKRGESESAAESRLLDRGYVVVERYSKKESVFAEFNALKYRSMAAFGAESGKVFEDTFNAVNSILASARILALFYWPSYGQVPPPGGQPQDHREEIRRHEAILWETGREPDEIKSKLADVQSRLEKITGPCFKELSGLYSVLIKPL